MARYQIILAYDGTDFQGFQRQVKIRTVQGEFEEALRALNWKGKSLLSAGRTDTGVHASGQVLAFDLDWSHSVIELGRALNANLPPDMVVKEVKETLPGFHPRYDAYWRSYEYCFFFDTQRNPLRERYAWRLQNPVDADLMRHAARILVGEHDFAAFGSPPHPGHSTIRNVYSITCEGSLENLRLTIVANAFLYHMVRRITYLLVQVGQQRISLEELENGVNLTFPLPPGLAPAQGLFLTCVGYLPYSQGDSV